MTSRALGAGFALLAALAFVTAFAGGAAPKIVPGWWDGHPRIEGRVFVRKDLHIGLVAAYGCNRGETVTCQPLTTETGKGLVGFVELGVLALLVVTAVALMRTTMAMDDRRKRLGKAVLIQAAVAALGGVIVLALGPQIKATQRFEVPIGTGIVALWVGVVFAVAAGVIAMRLRPEPLRLRSSQTHAVPPTPPSPPEPSPASVAQGPSAKQDLPAQPKAKGASASRPPPIPAASVSAQSNASAKSSSPPDRAPPAALAQAHPPAGGGDAASSNAAPFGSGTIPPPLSAISFWSQSATPIAAASPGSAPSERPLPGVAPAPLPGVAPAPLPGVAPPIPSAVPAAPKPPSFAGAVPSPPALPPPSTSAPPIPRSVVSALPTIIHAVPPPPSVPSDPAPPAPPAPSSVSADHAPQTSPTDEATMAPGSDDTVVQQKPSDSAMTTSVPGDATTTAKLEAAGPDAPGPAEATPDAPSPAEATPEAAGPEVQAASSDDTAQTNAAAGDSASPPVEVPLSTAPASLPPPKKTAAADSELSASCPQCEAAMSWVEEHLRFYCGECRMYF